MEQEKNLGGRPVKWDDPEAFEIAVNEYFDDQEILHTWTGLALHLGFASRDSLNDYKKKDGFSDSVKKALMRIENKYEEAALTKKNPAGAIFALKNFGWKDRQEIDMTANVSTSFMNIDPLADEANNGTTEDSATQEA